MKRETQNTARPPTHPYTHIHVLMHTHWTLCLWCIGGVCKQGHKCQTRWYHCHCQIDNLLCHSCTSCFVFPPQRIFVESWRKRRKVGCGDSECPLCSHGENPVPACGCLSGLCAQPVPFAHWPQRLCHLLPDPPHPQLTMLTPLSHNGAHRPVSCGLVQSKSTLRLGKLDWGGLVRHQSTPPDILRPLLGTRLCAGVKGSRRSLRTGREVVLTPAEL